MNEPIVLARELATFRRLLPELLDREGQYAVIQGDELAGVELDYEAALVLGYERFGLGPWLVKKIERVETVDMI